MPAARPTSHPVTGQTLPRRRMLRRRSWDFLEETAPSWVAQVKAGGTFHPPSTERGFQVATTAAVIGDRAYIGSAIPFGIAGPVGDAINAWHAVGFHVDGLRSGSIATTPGNTNGTKIGLSISDLAFTSGFSIVQSNSDANASLVVHGDAIYPLAGTSVDALDILGVRSTKIGAMFDPATKEAIIYTLDHLGTMVPLIVRSIPNVNVTQPVQPRIYVEALSATSVQIQVAKIDLDIWT